MKNKELHNARSTIIRIKVTSETRKELEQLIRENQWTLEEGYRIILGAGMGYIQASPPKEEDLVRVGMPRTKKEMINRMVIMESLLASTRFRMFELQQANSRWELSTGAVFAENTSLKALLKEKEQQIHILQEELDGLQEQARKIQAVDGKESITSNPASMGKPNALFGKIKSRLENY